MRKNEIFWQEITSEVKRELKNIKKLREELENVLKEKTSGL